MNSPAEDIKDLLVAATIGTFAAASGWSIHTAQEPAEASGVTPASVITLYDTGAWQKPHPTDGLQYPTLQVRVRAESYQAGWTKAEAIRDGLIGIQNQVISGADYIGCWVSSEILPLGFDALQRALFTVNFQFIRQASVGVSNFDGVVTPSAGAQRSITRTAIDYTVARTDCIIYVDCTTGARTITLPDAIINSGLTFTVRKIDASANTVTVSPVTSGQLLNGAATSVISNQMDSRDYFADGVGYGVT